ncbi:MULTISPECIES: GlcG/HbpS family heme-binding protein [unclassified Meridianimarinicoccus]|uniref:GlcG/HbpS family heme-binding protein n=1 Tax=unclassified Meridianimarinicoccus TaxID=2923344 RepID=UPI001866D9B6|nr:heme-binding protein [Fluviibacterium sp. MJW13]
MTRIAPIALAATLVATCATAQDDDAFVTFKVLKPEVALQAAQAALEHCRAGGYQVGVTVVDRFGVPQVFLRDRFAGAHVQDTSFRKAWTSVSFRAGTSELNATTAPGSESYGIRFLDLALPLGGGLVVQDGDGSIVAGIGVSGAPGPSLDDECAEAGIAAIEDQIAF